MIPNLGQERMFGKQQGDAKGARVVDPAAIPYEVVDVTMWDFNLPCGPSQFMIETNKGDFVKEEKDRFKIRARQDGQILNVCIYKSQLYFHATYDTKARIRIVADEIQAFTPTKGKK